MLTPATAWPACDLPGGKASGRSEETRSTRAAARDEADVAPFPFAPAPILDPMNDFVRHLLDLLEGFEGVEARRMFGGHGLFRHGLMFGLVHRETLYLKCDQENQAGFEARGLPPFRYERRGKTIALRYRQAPAEALEDEAVLAEWARRAWEAALRSHPES